MRLPRGSGRDETVRSANLWAKYKVTPEQYDAVRQAQDYRCAICDRHETELPARSTGRPRKDGSPNAAAMTLVVDHDHMCCPGGRSCGYCNRGLICVDCNAALGFFEDNPVRMLRAANYVQRSRGLPSIEWAALD